MWHVAACYLPPDGCAAAARSLLPSDRPHLTPHQAVFGIERVVDATIAKKVPAIAYGATVAVRFINNVIGALLFLLGALQPGCLLATPCVRVKS